MPNTVKDINAGVSLVLFMMLTALLYANYKTDEKNMAILDACDSKPTVAVPTISRADRLAIEAVFEDYAKKKTMNLTNCSQIKEEVKTGAIRGALAAAVMGGGVSEAAAGAIVYGMISGMSKAYKLQYDRPQYLHPDRYV